MKIWIDIENTPHAMIFNPIIAALKQKGHDVFVTAKNVGFTLGMLDNFRVSYTVVGEGVKRKKILKAGGAIQRSLSLVNLTKDKHFDIALNHGSRSHIGACWLKRINCITSYDYEYSSKFLVHQMTNLILVPEVFDDDFLLSAGASCTKFRKYPGLKEELYLAGFKPDDRFSLPVPQDRILVVIRPPSSTGHYHNPVSEETFYALLEKIAVNDRNIVAWVVPRTKEEGEMLTEKFSSASGKIYIQKKAVNGLDLIWRADLVVGGGGTMTREAAVMNVPSYSIFASRIGAVDRFLIESGRLNLVKNASEIDKIMMVKRLHHSFVPPSPKVLDFFLDALSTYS